MSLVTFTEVARAMLSLGKPLQIESCNVCITSFTQDRSPITQRAWVDITFREMSVMHPIYICILDTEPVLIGQDLLDRLSPLIDCHRGHIWAQVSAPTPLGREMCLPASDSKVAAIESRTPLPMIMPLAEPNSTSAPHALSTCSQTLQDKSQSSFHEHESFLCLLKNTNSQLYSPHIVGGVHLNGTSVPEALLVL